MKVFVFDLLAYDRQIVHLKTGAELPYPLGKAHLDAATAVRTYGEHLQAWEEMDRLGYDGVGFNEHHKQAAHSREDFRNMTMADMEQRAEHMPWGRPDEVAERLIAEGDKTEANTVLVSLNRGAMPHEMFLNQIRRFGRAVRPRLQAHEVRRVPVAEAALAA